HLACRCSQGERTLDQPMLEAKIEELRKELDKKHTQNRRHIHDLRNRQQEMLNSQHALELKLAPVLGNGTPGVLEQIAEVKETLQQILIGQAVATGIKKFLMWAIPVGISVLAIVIPILVVVFERAFGR